MLPDESDVGRFAYKSIRIHQGRFADTILVDSHTSKSFRIQFESTTLKSIRIHNLSWFAYTIWVDSHTKRSIRLPNLSSKLFCVANITQGGLLRAPGLSFWILLALIKNELLKNS